MTNFIELITNDAFKLKFSNDGLYKNKLMVGCLKNEQRVWYLLCTFSIMSADFTTCAGTRNKVVDNNTQKSLQTLSCKKVGQ